MSNYKLNHSRYIDNGAKDIADDIYWNQHNLATAKQIRFFNSLQKMCRENNVSPDIKTSVKTRAEYAYAIDKMIYALSQSGIKVNGNGKQADVVLRVGEDEKGRMYAREEIVFRNQPKKKPPKIENIFIKQGEL